MLGAHTHARLPRGNRVGRLHHLLHFRLCTTGHRDFGGGAYELRVDQDGTDDHTAKFIRRTRTAPDI